MAGVRVGLEILLEERLDQLGDRRLALVCHPASVDSNLRHAADLLASHPEVHLAALMGPQHGARGETQDNMIEWEDYRDPVLDLPVFSLYGRTRQPTPEMLEGVDAVLFDLQDIGARPYTFIQTLALVMEACARLEKRCLVLDRPNPINGLDLEGPVLDPRFSSFVGLHPLPLRHAMTTGELALYYNDHVGLGCRLEVIAMRGWRRQMCFEETGLPWVPPSPNIPTPETARVYPGMCLLEGTNLSEGRGTTRPFEMSGAPWIDPVRAARELNALELPGVRFRPLHFIPTFHKWAGQRVGGVAIHVLEPRVFPSVLCGLAVLAAYRRQDPERFQWAPPPYEYEREKLPFDILCGTDEMRRQIEEQRSLREIAQGWKEPLEAFRKVRQRYLLY